MNFHEGDKVKHNDTGAIGTVIESDCGYGKISVDFGQGARLVYKWDCTYLTRDDARKMDRDEALTLLKKAGYAVRIWGIEDVHHMLDQYGEDENNPLDTTRYRTQITAHIMEGDDWAELSDKDTDAEQALWNMIHGTHHDHHEWFPAR